MYYLLGKMNVLIIGLQYSVFIFFYTLRIQTNTNFTSSHKLIISQLITHGSYYFTNISNLIDTFFQLENILSKFYIP